MSTGSATPSERSARSSRAAGIASKFGTQISEDPNAGGLSRKHIMLSVEHSLRRLQTDHIDLYQTHHWDGQTSVEEVAGALNQLVQDGKVRYLGSSNYSGWQLMKSLAAAGDWVPSVS